jgi:hypothetical protein
MPVITYAIKHRILYLLVFFWWLDFGLSSEKQAILEHTFG